MQRRSHIAFMCVLVGAVLFTVESHGQLFGRRWHARSQQSYQVSQENSKFKSLIERSSIRRSQGLPFVDVAVSGETQVKNGLIALTLSLKFSPEYPKAVTVKSVDVTGTNQASSTLTTGALMETHTKLVGLFRRNNRDAVRVSVVFNEYPTESVGFELQALQPATTVVHTPPRSFNFVPPHIAGDADFDAGNNNPTDFRMGVIIEISPDSRRLFARVRMYGKEPKSDYTEVNGTSPQEDPYVAYTCPIGMRIKSMETLPEDTFELHDRGDHRAKILDFANIVAFYNMKEQHTKLSKQIPGYSHWSIDCTFTRNNVVERWDVVGDVDGNEAGTLTRVNVSTYPTILVLEEE